MIIRNNVRSIIPITYLRLFLSVLFIIIIILTISNTYQIYESFRINTTPIYITPPITFIVLEKHMNRVNNINQIIKKESITKYNIFNAIDGSDLDRTQLLKNGLITQTVVTNIKSGVIGCTLSHINTWLNFMETTQNNLVILEDDIDVVNNFKYAISRTLYHLPSDYDICYFQHRDNLDNSFKRTTINKYIKHGCPQYGAIGYLISKKGANKLIKYCLPIYNAIDIMIPDAIRNHKIISYISNEDIVFHKYKFTSVVCGKGRSCTPGITEY